MSDAEKQLAGFLIILLKAAREAIQAVDSDEFEELDDQFNAMVKKLKPVGRGDPGDVC